MDTAAVETKNHYPSDSSLLGDGARVLTRTMKKIDKKVGGLKKKIRDRMRTAKKRVVAIARATGQTGPQREERQQKEYARLLTLTRKTLNQTKGVLEEVEQLSPRRRGLQCGRRNWGTMADRVRQVVKRARRGFSRGPPILQENRQLV